MNDNDTFEEEGSVEGEHHEVVDDESEEDSLLSLPDLFQVDPPAEKLMEAAEAGDLNLLEEALQEGAEISARGFAARTALHWAIQNERWDAALRLLEVPGNRTAMLEAVDVWGNTPFLLSCEKRNLSFIQTLVRLGCNPNQRNGCGWTGLGIACGNGHINVAEYFITRLGVDPNVATTDCQTPLHLASGWNRDNSHHLVALLLDHGANIHTTCSDPFAGGGMTPLHVALLRGSLESIQLLLIRGARVAERTAQGQTTLHLAAQRRLVEVVQELLDCGLDIFDRDNNDKTPLDYAHENFNENVCDLLLTVYRGQLVARDGALALHVLLRDVTYEQRENGRLRLKTEVGNLTLGHFQMLLQPFLPNRLRSRDSQGRLPLHVAAEKSAPVEVLEMLMFRDACRVPDHTGSLPIHHACRGSAPLQVIRYLVDTGGVETIRKPDLEGHLPLHSLFQDEDSNGPSLEVVKYLVDAHPPSVFEQPLNGDLPLSARTLNGDMPLTMAGATAPLNVIYYLTRQHLVNSAIR